MGVVFEGLSLVVVLDVVVTVGVAAAVVAVGLVAVELTAVDILFTWAGAFVAMFSGAETEIVYQYQLYMVIGYYHKITRKNENENEF